MTQTQIYHFLNQTVKNLTIYTHVGMELSWIPWKTQRLLWYLKLSLPHRNLKTRKDGKRMVSVPAVYTARKGLIMKITAEENVKMRQILLKDVSTKLVACFAQRACSITACRTLKEISLILARVTLAMTSSACAGWRWWRCPSSLPVCAATSPCERATTAVRCAGAVEESIKPRDESVLCQTELKNLCFQEASNLDL